jgi:hypothetical protein
MTMIEAREVNGFRVEFYHDPDTESPRDMTHGCEMVLSHRKYDLPNDAGLDLDDFGGWGEVGEALEKDGALLVLPVYMMDHSEVSLSVADYGDPWDSGQLGLAYVTPQNWADTQGTKWTGDQSQVEQAQRLIADEVQIYGQYLNGECFGFRVLDFDGEELDSCWGFIGFDTVEEAAGESARDLERKPKCTGTLNRRTGEVEHSGHCPVHGNG